MMHERRRLVDDMLLNRTAQKVGNRVGGHDLPLFESLDQMRALRFRTASLVLRAHSTTLPHSRSQKRSVMRVYVKRFVNAADEMRPVREKSFGAEPNPCPTAKA
jgi:hypothetical protein